MLILISIWVMFGIAAAVVANNRGGSGCLYFIAGIFLGPIGFLLAFTEGTTCPHCRSKIHEKATKCPKCQSLLTQPIPHERAIIPLDESVISQPMTETSKTTQKTAIRLLWTFVAVVLVVVFVAYNQPNHNDSTPPSKLENDKSPGVFLPTDSRIVKGDTLWRSATELKVGNRLINTHELRHAIEEAIGMPYDEKHYKSDATWVCQYSADGGVVEVTYKRYPETGQMWASKIRYRSLD